MREILTLQFGHRANFVAQHFWNIQESYFTYPGVAAPTQLGPHASDPEGIIDHDIHFRAGLAVDGTTETYTPRTIIYDLKGGFGTLRRENALYDRSFYETDTSGQAALERLQFEANGQSGAVKIQQAAHIPLSDYQRALDAGQATKQLTPNDVRFWSDYNRVFYHPRSIVQLNDYQLNSQIQPFENWTAGEELFEHENREADGIADRDVRRFVEECDGLQGLMIYASIDDAWGGWTSSYIRELIDQIGGKKGLWVWGLEEREGNSGSVREKMKRAENVSRSIVSLHEEGASAVIRAASPGRLAEYVHFSPLVSEWDQSALLASAVESATLTLRLKQIDGSRVSTMSEMEDVLGGAEDRSMYSLGLSVGEKAVPAADGANDDRMAGSNVVQEYASEDQDVKIFDIRFNPKTPSLMGQKLNDRNNRDHVFGQVEVSRRPVSLRHRNLPVLDLEEAQRRRYSDEAVVDRYDVPLLFPRLDTMPLDLFTFPNASYRSGWPLQAGLTTSSGSKRDLFELRDLVTRFNRGVEIEDKEELYSSMTIIGEKYNFGWDDSDSNEDD